MSYRLLVSSGKAWPKGLANGALATAALCRAAWEATWSATMAAGDAVGCRLEPSQWETREARVMQQLRGPAGRQCRSEEVVGCKCRGTRLLLSCSLPPSSLHVFPTPPHIPSQSSLLPTRSLSKFSMQKEPAAAAPSASFQRAGPTTTRAARPPIPPLTGTSQWAASRDSGPALPHSITRCGASGARAMCHGPLPVNGGRSPQEFQV
jgi:hypothetical protein